MALLVGVNVFNGEPFTELTPTTGPNLTKSSTYEIGYKGLLSDKISFSADLYHIRSTGFRSFTQIAPLMTLQGANIATDLGAVVGSDFGAFFIDLVTPIVGAEAAAGFAAQLVPLVGGAYAQGGQAFVDAVPAPLLSSIFGAVETSRMSKGDGIVHVPLEFAH